ncbi:Rrf2 family transcriptional regulator [Aminivibrio sp.]|jgi:Rrf2 family protein|uniref:RrF2 family transcriptional regulator n=1 Tax=Aminivibrio sp. TaxID=1872489 RepID=UPI001A37593F|nr:Rrf2 family transcriptional regulator [Aminivibrio sp.]MBL3539019.1 Rrf2 family transcriptional regulator [Aminivibrio sp.]MDK2959398.1 Rrf2 family transcriptional regulator, nitric oxide-sensitive transcriptional repressor [Synergistaceae bacterium]
MSGVVAVSEAVSLAFHGMGILASGRRMSVKEMAETVSVSESHLAKVFQKLAKEGLVTSVRGPGGGFQLARDPGEISLFRIYTAIEGVPKHDYCLIHSERCPFGSCIFGSLLGKMTDEFVEYLKNTTLKDLERGETR